MNVYGTIHAQVIYQGHAAKLGKQAWLELDNHRERPTDAAMTAAIAGHLAQYHMALVKIEGWSLASDYRAA